MARQHLHALGGAALRGEVQRGPTLVVPHVQVHQGFGKCLEGFTVTIVGLGTERDTSQRFPRGPTRALAHPQTREVAPNRSDPEACGEPGL